MTETVHYWLRMDKIHLKHDTRGQNTPEDHLDMMR